jgi:hypothetical protein
MGKALSAAPGLAHLSRPALKSGGSSLAFDLAAFPLLGKTFPPIFASGSISRYFPLLKPWHGPCM